MKKFLFFGLIIVAFIILYVNVNAEADEIVIPEAARSFQKLTAVCQSHQLQRTQSLARSLSGSADAARPERCAICARSRHDCLTFKKLTSDARTSPSRSLHTDCSRTRGRSSARLRSIFRLR